ncbi:hypothetical protein DXG03_006964 [Asterophora parasitica]|uniref:Uncharacterized protein n=1 Tax=Asterophora parasitica TaxID=117018 RepID=A0A9P7K9C3_9AGAR|nr:hypothetical protein DXG03_006964 [Asterophora parasitica]
MYLVRSFIELATLFTTHPGHSNTVFFNIWSACLLSDGDATLPLYKDWISQCQKKSLDPKDGYPKQFAGKVDIPQWAAIGIPGNLTFDYATAIQVAKSSSSPWGTAQIIAPIAAILGTLTIGAIVFVLYRRSGKRTGTSNPFRWRRPHKVRRVDPVDRNTSWLVDRDDGRNGSHIRLPSSEEALNTMKSPVQGSGYHLPLKNAWKNSQVAQQLRRLPEQLPMPWKDRAVQITSEPPGRRFRVDPSNSSSESGGMSAPTSRSGTVEGDRPETIHEEEEEYPETEFRDSLYGDEETSLISPVERYQRDILISRTPGVDFTLESGSSQSNSRSSYPVKVIPPTPTTNSSRHSQNRVTIKSPPPTIVSALLMLPLQPRDILHPSKKPPRPPQRPSIPPAPSTSIPIPPDSDAPGPKRVPSPQTSLMPKPSNPVHPVPPPFPPPTGQLPPTPKPVFNHGLLPVTHIQRRPSQDNDDPLRRNGTPRPMGARLPSSPRAAVRQLSLDDEVGNLVNASVQSLAEYIGTPKLARTPLPSSGQQLAHAGGGGGLATPPRLTHNRNYSTESVVPDRNDPIMLFPGAVRAAGYTFGSSVGASESSLSLHSTTSGGTPRALPNATRPRDRM